METSPPFTSRQKLRSACRGWAELHPEWWLLIGSAAAWCSIFMPGDATLIAICSSYATAAAAGFEASRALGAISPVTELVRWQLMCAAMMLPLTIGPLRHVAFRSFAARRNRALAIFVTGYLGVWMTLGIAVVAIQTMVATAGDLETAWMIALAIAGTWQFSAVKTKALRRCNRDMPLSPHGARADADCVRFGLFIGANCTASCGPIMAALALAPHEPMLMVAAQAVVVIERYEFLPGHPRFAVAAVRRTISRWLAGRRPRYVPFSR